MPGAYDSPARPERDQFFASIKGELLDLQPRPLPTDEFCGGRWSVYQRPMR
jgi:hypothetical protein